MRSLAFILQHVILSLKCTVLAPLLWDVLQKCHHLTVSGSLFLQIGVSEVWAGSIYSDQYITLARQGFLELLIQLMILGILSPHSKSFHKFSDLPHRASVIILSSNQVNQRVLLSNLYVFVRRKRLYVIISTSA